MYLQYGPKWTRKPNPAICAIHYRFDTSHNKTGAKVLDTNNDSVKHGIASQDCWKKEVENLGIGKFGGKSLHAPHLSEYPSHDQRAQLVGVS
jgi:hypothetical protein